MRTAIISDIHGNLNALVAVFADIGACGCDRVVCLGDVVDGGPSDLGSVRMLMDRGVVTVRGNHDECAQLPSDSQEKQYLDGLADRLAEGDVVFVHITARAAERKVSDRYEAWNVFDETPQRIVFIGHTHIPMIYGFRGGTVGAAKVVGFEHGRPVALDPADRYIVSVGAVGYGRDGIAAARYCIFDDGQSTVEIRRVEAPMLGL